MIQQETKLIKADGIKKVLEAKAEMLRTGCPDNLYGIFMQKVSQMIDLIPAVDAIPVTRCRDCLYCRSRDNDNPKEARFVAHSRWCTIYGVPVFAEDFCSSAEPHRKDNKE